MCASSIVEDKLSRVKHLIETEVFIPGSREAILDRKTRMPSESGWIFDFRRVLLRAETLDNLGEIFWDKFKDKYPFQICGLEVAAIPLVTGLVLKVYEKGKNDASGFFVRKSRKKDGLMRMVEGKIDQDKRIILVDDIINSGKSFIRQVEVLEELGFNVDTVWSVLRFRDEDYYTYFKDKGIKVISLFSLDDFKETLGLKNKVSREFNVLSMPFKAHWKFQSENPNYFYVVAKSDPILDDERVYMGSDSGVFWALNQRDGSIAWSYKVGFHAKGKSIFSSPAIWKDTVLFGAYDGNFYALNKETGEKKWIFFEADSIGSSPAIADDLCLAFIGLEFGLIKKRGGIAAIDLKTGKKVWDYIMPAYTHSSPIYIKKKRQIVVGSNDGAAYLFDAKSGVLIWKFQTGHPTEEELQKGFSEYDIKESFAYDMKRDLIIFGNVKGEVFAIARDSGEKMWSFKAEFGFYSTPVIYKDTVLISSVDRHLYCLNLDDGKEKWRWRAGARIFATPVVVNGSVYIGANTGRLTELDPETGEVRSFVTVPERITNKVAYNERTGRFFLPTFANELYCLERNDKTEKKS
jgi:orotate phosphoribosyltransferase